MAKKKSTMSLKDFHGGVIPTDLQLPSAPGMSVDRGTYERHQGWNNNRGYGSDRGRQTPGNGFRAFEDKASYFLNNGANIGRNFDEDERRPVDGRPRSSPSIERSAVDFSGRNDKTLDSRIPGYSRDYDNRNKAQVRPWDHVQQPVTSYAGAGRLGSQPGPFSAPRTPPEKQINAWGIRDQQREAEASAPWRVRNSVARIAEASALDKVSSGRWQPGASAGGLERTRSVEDEKLISRNMQDELRKVDTLQITHNLEDDSRRGYEGHPSSWTAQVPVFSSGERLHEYAPGRQVEYGGFCGDSGRTAEVSDGGLRSCDHAERNDHYRRDYKAVEDTYGGVGREEHHRGGYDRLEVHGDGGRYDSQGVPDIRNAQPYYSSDDPSYLERLSSEVFLEKFQPRGPLEWERSRSGQANQQPPPSTAVEAEKTRPRSRHQQDHYEAGTRPGSADTDHDFQRPSTERPKLNLKPRSQPSEDAAGSEKQRRSLFGGARPRELVLKERGVDDVTIAGLDSDNSDGGKVVRADTRRPEIKQGGRHDPRNSKVMMRSESDRYDGRRDYARHDQQQHQEVRRDIDRRDSWRRPADPTVSALAELPSRSPTKPYTGATSAIELAQAFSRLTSATPSPGYSNNNIINTNTNRQRAVDKHNAAAW